MGLFKPSQAALDKRQQKRNKALLRAYMEQRSLGKIATLLEEGASPETTTASGIPLLAHIALSTRMSVFQAGVADLLLAQNVDINRMDQQGNTALMRAARAGNKNILTTLLQRGADLHLAAADGATAFSLAIEKSDWAACRLLESHQALGAMADDKKDAALLHMVDHAAPSDIVHAMIRAGANVHVTNPATGDTLLHKMALEGQRGVEFALQLKAAPIDARNHHGKTPLLCVLENGGERVALHLIQQGADVALADNDGVTPLHVTARKGMIPMTKTLLSNMLHAGKLDPAVVTQALREAANAGHARIVEILKDAGGDLDMTFGENARSLLMEAVFRDDKPMFETLLKLGARTDVTDATGLTVHDHIAMRRRDDRVYAGLMEAKQPAKTPLESAYRMMDAQTVEIARGSLSSIFNFSTQQLIYRDAATGAMTAQNFADVARQEAIEEAAAALTSLGGTPAPYHGGGMGAKKALVARPSH